MKRFISTIALLLYTSVSFAQKQSTEARHPCLLPVPELYNEKQEKLPEGAIPGGKIMLRLQKNEACLEGVTYEVLKVYLVPVRGYLPMGEIRADGNVADLSEMESNFHRGDRLYLELKVKYTTDKGKTGEFTFSHNWLFKQE